MYSNDEHHLLTINEYDLPECNCKVACHVHVDKKGMFRMKVPECAAQYIDSSFHETKAGDCTILVCNNLKQLDTVVARAFRLHRENRV